MDPKIEKNGHLVHTFEEAVSLTGNGKFHFFLLFITGCSLLAVAVEGLNMAFVLPTAKCEITITETEQGLINSVTFIGVVLTSHFWGFMSDTWGRKKVLQSSLLLTFIFSAISSFSTTSLMLLLTRFIVGLAISGVQAAAISYLGEFYCNINRARYVTFASMFLPMSAIYQSIMALFIMPMPWKLDVFGVPYTPWRIYISISSLINAVGFIGLLFLPESPRFELAMGKPEEAIRILKIAYRINKGKLAETFPVTEIHPEAVGSSLGSAKGVSGILKLLWNQTWPLFKPPILSNMLMMCYLVFVSYASSHGFYVWIPQILSYYYLNMEKPMSICDAFQLGVEQMDHSNVSQNVSDPVTTSSLCGSTYEPTTYYIVMIIGWVFILCYSVCAVNTNRFGMKNVLTFWVVISAISAIAMIWSNNFYLNMTLLTMMLTVGNCAAILTAIAADLFPIIYKGMALSIIMMFSRIGAVVGSNYVGALLYGYCDGIFIINGVTLLIVIVVCFYMLQKIYRKKDINM